MPRVRKFQAPTGLIHFEIGTSEEVIEQLLKRNEIERDKDSPKYMTTMTSIAVMTRPIKEELICPDDIYIWLKGGA